jgi:hypothetical protein
MMDPRVKPAGDTEFGASTGHATSGGLRRLLLVVVVDLGEFRVDHVVLLAA